jgi:hypothetical protein
LGLKGQERIIDILEKNQQTNLDLIAEIAKHHEILKELSESVNLISNFSKVGFEKQMIITLNNREHIDKLIEVSNENGAAIVKLWSSVFENKN